ncbi:MAG: SDR family oxidoreductase [Acidimicrobiia bacterium]|nr:SDR family oxidoreductase [Acidimicrobiia bacterium]NNL70195.1 SDR family oxidoreductase [Acidimicrobiia bacterium]
MEPADRVVVITGGGGGIGAALARRFHAEGARHVAVADIDRTGAEAVAADVGGSAHVVDAADGEAVAALVESVENTAGPVDLFCANAGVAVAGGVDADTDAWQRSWDVNVMSQVYAARAVLPSMLSRGEGYLVLTASAAGLTTSLDTAPYAVTKHASVALAEWLAITYGDAGIRVSCLAPQFVDTSMGRMAGSGNPAAEAWVRSVMIEADDVAAAVIDAVQAERFLILPHPEVEGFFRNKAADYDRWLGGMRKLRRGFQAP